MKLFDKFFKESASKEFSIEKNKEFVWIAIETGQILKEILEKSEETLQVIYKHSTSCGISSMVLRKFQQAHIMNQDKAAYYLLDLLANRTISNEVSVVLGVQHQSPQLLLIKDGSVVAHYSHYEILQANILDFI